MAENLKKRGLDVTIVEFLDQAVGSLDREMAAVLHGHLREKGISLRLRTADVYKIQAAACAEVSYSGLHGIGR